MESLAYVVVIIMLCGILSAPVSMALTFSRERWMYVAASIVATFGVFIGVQFMLADLAIGGQLIGFSITFFNLWALARVIKYWEETASK